MLFNKVGTPISRFRRKHYDLNWHNICSHIFQKPRQRLVDSANKQSYFWGQASAADSLLKPYISVFADTDKQLHAKPRCSVWIDTVSPHITMPCPVLTPERSFRNIASNYSEYVYVLSPIWISSFALMD